MAQERLLLCHKLRWTKIRRRIMLRRTKVEEEQVNLRAFLKLALIREIRGQDNIRIKFVIICWAPYLVSDK